MRLLGSPEWSQDAIRAFAALGLLDPSARAEPGAVSEAVGAALARANRSWRGSDAEIADVTLLRLLGSRAAVFPEDPATPRPRPSVARGYVTLLLRLANAARGGFDVGHVQEIWESGEGPVTVLFTLDGIARRVHPLGLLGAAEDRALMDDLNRMILHKGIGFHLVRARPRDDGVAVLVLSHAARRHLEEARRWNFLNDFPPGPRPLPVEPYRVPDRGVVLMLEVVAHVRAAFFLPEVGRAIAGADSPFADAGLAWAAGEEIALLPQVKFRGETLQAIAGIEQGAEDGVSKLPLARGDRIVRVKFMFPDAPLSALEELCGTFAAFVDGFVRAARPVWGFADVDDRGPPSASGPWITFRTGTFRGARAVRSRATPFTSEERAGVAPAKGLTFTPGERGRGARSVLLVAGVDASLAFDSSGRSLADRFGAGDVGPPREGGGTLRELEAWVAAGGVPGLRAFAANVTDARAPRRLVLGSLVGEISVGSQPPFESIPLDDARAAIAEAARALRAASVVADPQLFLVYRHGERRSSEMAGSREAAKLATGVAVREEDDAGVSGRLWSLLAAGDLDDALTPMIAGDLHPAARAQWIIGERLRELPIPDRTTSSAPLPAARLDAAEKRVRERLATLAPELTPALLVFWRRAWR